MRRLLAGLLMGIMLPAAAAPRAITIENNTDGVLRGVYATETGDDNWRADRLQENIQVGATATIPLPTAACHYDFRVLLESRPTSCCSWMSMSAKPQVSPWIAITAGR